LRLGVCHFYPDLAQILLAKAWYVPEFRFGMALEQAQQFSLQQALSPQMQRSLHVLQAPIADLRQMVDEELAQNPALEEVEPSDPEGREPEAQAGEGASLGDEWREYYAQRATAEPWTQEALDRRQMLLDSQTRAPTLLEHVSGQLDTTSWPQPERAAAEVFLGSLDANGYFRGQIEEAAYPLGLTVARAEEVLDRVQQLDPPGVGARDLKECLLLQLRRMGRADGIEARIVTRHLDALARRKLPEIARALGVGVGDVRRAAEVIRSLDPRPGRAFAPDENPMISADVVVERNEEGQLEVRFNDTEIPRLRLSNDFKDMLGTVGATRDAREFIREKLRTGRFFMSCLEQRRHTILAIARAVVARQELFFEIGPPGLKPMTMGQVAAEVGVHETTVSRAVSGKYMATPRGLFEMKYFFRTGFATGEGGSMSNEGVRQAVAEMVRGEDPARPLSDQDLVEALASRGITIARRTVAKYRDQLGILPSHLRRDA
jgi:RNA polymerase sigma-54 factor